MLNQCNFIGNLGADPEIRTMSNGSEVANFSIGCTEKWKEKATGEKKEKTEWIRISVFGNLVGVVKSYLKKGSKVYVSGKFKTRKWTDKDGQDRYSTEIVLQGFSGKLLMLDGKSEGGASSGGAKFGEHLKAEEPVDDFDDSEIPF